MRALMIAAIVALATPAAADCYGTGIYQSCTDANGGSSFSTRGYTDMSGYDAPSGTSWHGTANSYGHTTAYQGMASDGTTWSGQANSYGYGYSSSSGLSNGGSYYNGFTYGN